jgi:hypothetical protein
MGNIDDNKPAQEGTEGSLRTVVREVIGEFLDLEKNKSEPAYKAELEEERRRREALERRLNELAEENHRTRERAEEAERSSLVRSELQRLGVSKVDLAFKAVKDDIVRTNDGRLVARDGQAHVDIKDYLSKFVQENPELLPPRMSGGSGATITPRTSSTPPPAFDIERIKPGMDPRELEQIRKEIARIASRTGVDV